MDDKKNNKTNNEFKINQYLIYIGPFLIFLGMVRLITFYNSFGVPITSYLDLSEIITSFFDIIILVVIIFLYSSIQNFLANSKEDADKVNKKRQAVLNEVNSFKICLLYVKYLNSLIIYGFLFITGCIVAHYYFNWISAFAIFILAGVFIFLLVFIIVQVEIERKHIQFNSTANRKRIILFMLYFLVFTIGVVQYSSFQASQIKNTKSTFGVSITLDNDNIFVSDSSNYFIGKTQNYVFIYHEKESKTDIIPMSRIKQITIKNRITTN